MKSNFAVELLPDKGRFVLTLEDGTKVKGRFSMYALDRLCEKKSLTYLQLFIKITGGMTIREYAELLLVALEDYYREDIEQCTVVIDGKSKRWTEDLIMDQVFDVMGFGNETSLSLFKHAAGRLFHILPDDNEAKEQPAQQQKKSP